MLHRNGLHLFLIKYAPSGSTQNYLLRDPAYALWHCILEGRLSRFKLENQLYNVLYTTALYTLYACSTMNYTTVHNTPRCVLQQVKRAIL